MNEMKVVSSEWLVVSGEWLTALGDVRLHFEVSPGHTEDLGLNAVWRP
jgi:hypothetical protein